MTFLPVVRAISSPRRVTGLISDVWGDLLLGKSSDASLSCDFSLSHTRASECFSEKILQKNLQKFIDPDPILNAPGPL